MVNLRLSVRSQIGLDFFEFLEESHRASITNRVELRDIYNDEFRARNAGARDPNFGSVLYALKVSNKITRRGDKIHFKATVKALYLDQWHIPRGRQPQDGGPSTSQALPLTSGDAADTGVRARRRLASELLKKLKTERVHYISDKHGISITSDSQFDSGKLCLNVNDTDQCMINLRLENTGSETVQFTYYSMLHWLRDFSLSDEHKVTRTNPLTLKPGDNYEIQVNIQCSTVGFYPATLAFEFKRDVQAFHIVRFIDAHCMTFIGEDLAPIAPYKPCPIPAITPQAPFTIVDGQRPEGMSVMQLKNEVPLNQYKIPVYVNQLIQSLKHSIPFKDKSSLLESPLTMENYTDKFQLLLYLEEEQMQADIRRYNIPNDDRKTAEMYRDERNKKLLVLAVPGVAENRPSVLRGDQLLVYPIGESGVKFRGYVHALEQDQVKLGFGSELLGRFYDGMKFNVEFVVNRIPLRVQHRAAELASAHQLGKVLFPDAPSPSSCQPEVPKLRLFDFKLERNPEQYQAICHIVAGSSKPAPYLVFGPPGTGKTVTVAEAIKQIEKSQPNCHILVCAPSNSAADLLCTRILEHVDAHKLYRMYASSREPKFVPENLKECSNLVGDCYVFPAKEKLMEYKILVTTLITAGRLVSGNIPTGHFTHVFVDEAGHAVETECITPLAGLLQADTGHLVLAGDHKQLGPILRSPFAQKYDLGVSFLERMMKSFPLYQKDENETFNNRYVTKLLQNYRSHPAILKIPNELFYNGELQVCADEILRNCYCNWEHLPQRHFPVVFHGVTGRDEREASSPSFFNRAEVEILMDYVKKLLQTDGKKGLATISPGDIGIIAPYRKQVQKIRRALESIGKLFKFKNMNALKVGSVEEFQGQERRVIIISTVRSSPNYADIDQKFNLGFVKNEKRFNVAVTRAKALLIVVGNPVVLKVDPVWNCFIQYCTDEGGYTGYVRTEEDEEIVTRLSLLYITIEGEVDTSESVVQQLLDPEWRTDL